VLACACKTFWLAIIEKPEPFWIDAVEVDALESKERSDVRE
jgi:hypothetical protein